MLGINMMLMQPLFPLFVNQGLMGHKEGLVCSPHAHKDNQSTILKQHLQC